MTINGRLREIFGSALRSRGYEVVDARLLYDWQKSLRPPSAAPDTRAPGDANPHLGPHNPALVDLQRRYADFDKMVTTALVWTDSHVSADDMRHFRGENAYVWQRRGLNMSPLAYALSAYYAKAIDELRLLDRLTEDESFGNFSLEVDGRRVSRDLLDSVVEMYFLEKHLKLSSMPRARILDIGAGYGRLAHRMTTAYANVEQYLCTDAYAVSTFVSAYYLNYRRVADRAKVVALDEFDAALKDQRIDIAVNIHSFSECRPAAIEWWVARLAAAKVRHLMVVPNAGDAHDGSTLKTNDGIDFGPIIANCGYRCVAVEPKYRDAIVQRYGVNPTYHHLFELG